MANLGITKEDLVLVVGATGRQGGAVAKKLLENNWKIRVLARKSEKAFELKEKGAEIFIGNLDEPSIIEKAFQGVSGVFSVQNFWEAGYEKEIAQGKLLADLAKKYQVRHFIYSSVQSANRKTGIPHFESKWEIEEYIRQLKLPYTILRPVFLMQNFLYPNFKKAIESGVLPMEVKSNRQLQMVNVDHVGDFAQLSFAKQLIGEELDLASEELTPVQMADVFSKALGKHVKYMNVPLEESERTKGKEWAKMFEWFNKVGYNVNIQQLKSRYGLPLMDLNTFVYRIWIPQKLAV
jgi:uncharacterized protein YbjT (DUF2867 family)